MPLQFQQQILHRGENFHVVGRGGKYQPVKPEAIAQDVRKVPGGEIIDQDVLFAPIRQLGCQQLSGFFRVAVDGAISNHDPFFFRGVRRPFAVLIDVIMHILPQDGPVERQNHLNVEFCNFFQQCQHLAPILADNIGVITPDLGHQVEIHIILVCIQIAVDRAKSAKSVR